MGMRFGDSLQVTLFGESHGSCVGALIEGMPAGTPIDPAALAAVSYTHLTLPTIYSV